MNFIKDKKIHKAILIVVLFIALGFSGFYSMRGTLASYSSNGLLSFNDVWAFILSALINGGIYELITILIFKALSKKLGQARSQDMRYALRFFVVLAGIFSGLIKLFYFAYPFIFPYGEVLIEFIFMLFAFIPYLVFICKTYCEKEEYAGVTMTLGSAFLALYSVVTIFSLVVEVML